jgi:hypothetical protein
MCIRFHIVDNCRLSEKSHFCRIIGGLWPGAGRPSFERLKQGRFFTGNIGGGTNKYFKVERIGRTQDVFSEITGGKGFPYGFIEEGDAMGETFLDKKMGVFRSNGIGSDDHALDDLVGRSGDEKMIFVTSRLSLASVCDHIPFLDTMLGDLFPFHRRRKTGSTTTAKPGHPDLPDDIGRGKIEQGPSKALIPACRFIRQEGRILDQIRSCQNPIRTVHNMHIHSQTFMLEQ